MNRHVVRKLTAGLLSASLLAGSLSACVAERANNSGTKKPTTSKPVKPVTTFPGDVEDGTVTMKIIDKHGTCVMTFHPTKVLGQKPPRGYRSWTYTENAAALVHPVCKMAENPGSRPFRSAGYHLVGTPTIYRLIADGKKLKVSVYYGKLNHVLSEYRGKLKTSCYYWWKVYEPAYGLGEKTSWSRIGVSHAQWSGKCGGWRDSANAYKAEVAGKTYDKSKIRTMVTNRWTGFTKVNKH